MKIDPDQLRERIEKLLPPEKGFIIVLFDLGSLSHPMLIHNTYEEPAIEALRAIVQAKDIEDHTSLN